MPYALKEMTSCDQFHDWLIHCIWVFKGSGIRTREDIRIQPLTLESEEAETREIVIRDHESQSLQNISMWAYYPYCHCQYRESSTSPVQFISPDQSQACTCLPKDLANVAYLICCLISAADFLWSPSLSSLNLYVQSLAIIDSRRHISAGSVWFHLFWDLGCNRCQRL